MEVLTRPWKKDDIPSLVKIWTSVFGDPEELVEDFLRLLPEIGLAYVAEADGVPVSVCYAVTGIRMASGSREIRCAYLYSVATLPEHRGNGLAVELCRKCAEAAGKAGCHILYTRPDSDELFQYYAKAVGLNHISCCRTVEAAAAADGLPHSVEPVSAREYLEEREQRYSGQPHMVLSEGCLEFEKALCRSYGGDLYTVDSVPVAAYVEDGSLIIREICCDTDRAGAIASALCSYVNQDSYCLRFPSEGGEMFIESNVPSVPTDFSWGIVFD